jgi:hypothetical protein
VEEKDLVFQVRREILVLLVQTVLMVLMLFGTFWVNGKMELTMLLAL